MKILLVAMKSIHFIRWANQLKSSGYEVYWFDVLDMGYSENLKWLHQITGWKQKNNIKKGRYFLKRNWPKLHDLLSPIFYNSLENTFEKHLTEIKPDIVHSFAMQIGCLPILKVMQKYPDEKWIYSSWGSDLFLPESVSMSHHQRSTILRRVNYLITDCFRDYKVAKDNGFNGEFLGKFPGGGGYSLAELKQYAVLPPLKRNIILVKGYQDGLGQCIPVLKALKKLKVKLNTYQIVVFSADLEVVRYIQEENFETELNLKFFSKDSFLKQEDLLKLMGKSLIFIGNSISDGLPNTLIEAIIMGAFPIQSNPGQVTEELIDHKKNGLLINNPLDSEEIKNLVEQVLMKESLIEEAYLINQNEIKPKYQIEKITQQVLGLYKNLNNA